MSIDNYDDGYESERSKIPQPWEEGFFEWASSVNAPVVDMRPAFEFTCEHCGRDGMIRVILRETRTSCHMMVPAIFKCEHCGSLMKGVPIFTGGML